MAQIYDIPPEVLREIFFLVLLNDQSLTRKPERETNGSTPEELSALRNHSLNKLLSDTLVEGLEAVHTCKAGDVKQELMYYHFGLYQEFCASRVMRDDILALSFTSKRFRDITQGLLWKVVELGEEAWEGIDDVRGVLESVLRNPALGQLVRSLSFRSSGITLSTLSEVERKQQLDEWMGVVKQLFIMTASTDDIGLFSYLKTWEVWLQLALLVLLLPNLRSLKLYIDIPRSIEIDAWIWRIKENSDDSIASVLELAASRLENLQEFSLIIEDPDAGVSLDSWILGIPFLLPCVKTVYFGTTFADDVDTDNESSTPDKRWRTSPVTSLTIDWSLVSNENLIEILRFPKALENFSFSYAGLSNHLSAADAVEICRSLLPHRDSLKRLEIKGYNDLRREEQEPVGSLMTQFPVLEELGIPVALLQTTDLGSSFPQSVVKLKLYLYDECVLRIFKTQLDDMLSKKQKGLLYPYLKEIWIEHWCSVDYEYASRVDGEEWPTTRARMLDEMVTFAGEVGVRLTLDVDETSYTSVY